MKVRRLSPVVPSSASENWYHQQEQSKGPGSEQTFGAVMT
jgi:hypothetical protein